jgi:hypothetical protein
MIVAEADPIGGFRRRECLGAPTVKSHSGLGARLQLIHIDPWIAPSAFAFFASSFIFVPLIQAPVNRCTGSRIRIFRQLGIGVIFQTN